MHSSDGATPIPISRRARSGSVSVAPIDPRSSAIRAIAHPRALIVDDCRFIAERIARALEAKGFECHVADNGFAALEQARAERFDLFVLDVDLPFVDGFTLLRQLRRDAAHAQTKVLMLATERSDIDQARALELGANGYLNKPLQLRSLNAMLDSLLG